MSGLPNKSRGEVLLPEAGEGVYLVLTMDGMERFEGELGENYLPILFEQLGKLSAKHMKMALSVMMRGNGDISAAPFGLTLDEMKTRLLDAISLAINGKVFTEAQEEAREAQIKEIEEDFKKKQERVKADPSLAPLYLNDLLSRLASSEESDAGLDLKKSDDTPSPTSADTPPDTSET